MDSWTRLRIVICFIYLLEKRNHKLSSSDSCVDGNNYLLCSCNVVLYEIFQYFFSAMDLLQRMLAFNPLERITVVQALSHPYLAEFACPHDEPVAMQPLCIELEVCTIVKHRRFVKFASTSVIMFLDEVLWKNV